MTSVHCSYLARFTDEIEQIEIVNGLKGRTGHQYAARQNAITATQDRDRREFESSGLGEKVVEYCLNFQQN